MDADIQIMVAGTVQMDCQVCDSVTVSFLTHGFRHLWLWSFLWPSNTERGAGLLLGQSLPRISPVPRPPPSSRERVGSGHETSRKFPLSRPESRYVQTSS